MLKGRPTKYSEDITLEICEEIANGRSLRSIVKAEHMPAQSTIFKWLSEHKIFSEQYARAREAQADVYADEITSIADECEDDAAKVAKARLQIDSRKWLASKLKPKKYGDSILNKHADADGNKLNFASILDALDGRTASIPSADQPAE